MKTKRPPIPAIILLALIILLGGYFMITNLGRKADDTLAASGTIESVSVNLAPEISGKVLDIYVEEGRSVRAGEPLFSLDDTLLQAQRSVAETSLELAQASAATAQAALQVAENNYLLALNTARLASSSTRTADWRAENPTDYSLPGGYFTQDELITAAAEEITSARSARDETQNLLNNLVLDAANVDFIAAETRLNAARAAFIVAQDVLTQANQSSNSDLQASAQAAYDLAKVELEEAQLAYDMLKDSEGAENIILTRSDLAVSQERYESAQDRLLTLQVGNDSPAVVTAQSVLDQAVAAAQQAVLAVNQAEANLALIDVQVAKLTVFAPSDGVILTCSIQPGEVLPAGASALEMARLDDLTITVYIAEDRYGELSLGQQATVTVDSFPDQTFAAVITHIADEAEFTPRNVQTLEGRSTTVFAIRLQVENPDGKLKPGMPADISFNR